MNGRISGNNSITASMHLRQQVFAVGNTIDVSLCILSNKDIPHVTISLSKEISLRDGDNKFQAATDGLFFYLLSFEVHHNFRVFVK